MKVVIVSSEIAPFVKTGGLADVTGALPKYIDKEKFEVITIIPFYSTVNRDVSMIEEAGTLNITTGGGAAGAGLFRTFLPDSSVPLYLLRYGPFFDRKGIYGENGRDYSDNDLRFSFFCRGILEVCKTIGFKPDVIHCNDWQTGLIPLFLKTHYKDDNFFTSASVLFTIHNLAFHGLFEPERVINITGLPWDVYRVYGAEFYGMFSFQKSGIFYSDYISTVSNRYSEEIQSDEYGMGLQGLLKDRRDTLTGIINGVDYTLWNPSTDPLLKKNYDIASIENKNTNTEYLCELCGLCFDERVPVIGMITRLTEQKGIDLVAGIIDELMNKSVRLVLLGTGDKYYHRIFADFAEKYRGKLYVSLNYDEKLSHLIYAGSDIFLMPSRFEPCGLGQIISLRYGTIPVARETGGLAETINNYNSTDDIGNRADGFLFTEYSAKGLLECIERAFTVYKEKYLWRTLMVNAMKADFSWSSSAVKYEELYRKLCVTSEGLR